MKNTILLLLLVAILMGCSTKSLDAGSGINAANLSSPTKMRQLIASGNERYAHLNGLDRMWRYVKPQEISTIYNYSSDKQQILVERVAFTTKGDPVPGSIFSVVDLKAGAVIDLKTSQESKFKTASIAPNGDMVALIGYKAEDIWTVALASGQSQKVLSNDRAYSSVSSLKWSSDSTKIAFIIDRHELNSTVDIQKYDALWINIGRTTASSAAFAIKTSLTGQVEILSDKLGFSAVSQPVRAMDLASCVASLSGMIRAGEGISLKMPFSVGSSTVWQGYCGTTSHGGASDLSGVPYTKALDIGGGKLDLNQPILAVAAGTVDGAISNSNDTQCTIGVYDSAGVYGNRVVVRHVGINPQNGTTITYFTRSAHMQVGSVEVTNGQAIVQGTKLGTVGCTGNTDGPHTHFEMRRDSSYGSEVIPEPMDGQSGLPQGNTTGFKVYSSNIVGGGGGGADPSCVVPPYPFSPELSETGAEFVKEGPYPTAWWTDSSNGSGNVSTFTFSTITQENWAQWRFKPGSGDGYYDIYAFMPNPTSDNRPLGSGYGQNGPAQAVRYKLKNRDSGQTLAESGNSNQSSCRGKWVKVLSEMSLYAAINYAIELPDSIYNGATYGSQKVYYDNIGIKFVRSFPDTASPSVTISSPINNSSTTSPVSNVSGTATDNVGVTSLQYQLNGGSAQNVTLNGGNFSFSVNLVTGSNTIRVTARDAEGNSNSAERVITYQTMPTWVVSPATLTLPTGTVGGTAASSTFTLGNNGTGSGTPSVVSSNPAVLSVTLGKTGAMAPNESQTVTVSAVPCSSTASQTATITVSGGGSTMSPTVQVNRPCTLAAPAAAALSSISMSADGKVLITWPKVSGASSYGFAATFDNAPYTVSPDVSVSGTDTASAVLSFLTGANDPVRQNKQLCVSVQSKNSGGSSAMSAARCVTYRYYTGITPQSVSQLPQLWLEQR